MQWKGEVFFRLVGYAQKTYKIGINAASIPVDGPLARESSEYQSGLFRFLGPVLCPSASRSDAMRHGTSTKIGPKDPLCEGCI